MNPTLDDLRHVLQDEAAASPPPSADALVAGATARVQAARRRRTVLAGAAAVLVLAGGLLAGTHVGRKSSEPARTGPFRVVEAGSDFPEYSAGFKRLVVVSAPALERLRGTITVPTTPGRTLNVRMQCYPETITDFDQRVGAKVTGPSGLTAKPPCGFTTTALESGLLGTSQGTSTPLSLDVFVNHAEFTPGAGPSFVGATISLGVYESVPWSAYRLPSRPAGLEKSLDYAWTSPADRKAFVVGPAADEDPNTPQGATILGDQPGRYVTVEGRGPGRLKVTINGKPFDGGAPAGPLRDDDGWLELFDFVHVGATMETATFTQGAASSGKLRIVVTPEGFTGADWRVVVGNQP